MSTYQQDFHVDRYCYKTLSNHFYKSITLTKLLTSIKSEIKMYRGHVKMNYLMHYYRVYANII